MEETRTQAVMLNAENVESAPSRRCFPKVISSCLLKNGEVLCCFGCFGLLLIFGGLALHRSIHPRAVFGDMQETSVSPDVDVVQANLRSSASRQRSAKVPTGVFDRSGPDNAVFQGHLRSSFSKHMNTTGDEDETALSLGRSAGTNVTDAQTSFTYSFGAYDPRGVGTNAVYGKAGSPGDHGTYDSA